MKKLKVIEVKFSDLVATFETQEKTARAFDITQGAVSKWRYRGVPELRRLEFQNMIGADKRLRRRFREASAL